MRCSWLLLALLLMVRSAWAFDPDVARQDPADIVRAISAALQDGSVDRLSPWFTQNGLARVRGLQRKEQQDHALKGLGPVSAADLSARDEAGAGTSVDVTVTHDNGTALWSLTFVDAAARIDTVDLEVDPAQPNPPRSTAHHSRYHGWSSARPAPSKPQVVPSPPGPPASPLGDEDQAADARTVDFLFATTRKTEGQGDKTAFLADRSPALQYGTVRVHVPDQSEHQPGRVELPRRISFLGVTLYEAKLDEKKHFVIRYAKLLSDKEFYDTLASRSDKEALVFVHGFNNSFETSVYRFAQILFDLQYKKPAVLFSWASKGDIADYGYDKESALIARDSFRALLRNLRARGITKINVIAHSMGNLLAIDALANAAETADPQRVSQLIMAAPDVDRDYFRQMEPKLATIADGLTLYACATDRALMLSKQVAGGVPRAGDVPADGPVTMPGLDTIDVSALGQDWFGLNHDVFASNRSVLQDIVALLALGKRPPRLDMIHGMPLNTTPPTFWRFQP